MQGRAFSLSVVSVQLFFCLFRVYELSARASARVSKVQFFFDSFSPISRAYAMRVVANLRSAERPPRCIGEKRGADGRFRGRRHSGLGRPARPAHDADAALAAEHSHTVCSHF